ncbi:MAG: ABC transporter ATP-binding protein [Anaerovoracaceae bacterium]
MNSKIKLSNINKSYEKTQVLFDVSLEVPFGKVYGLLGPSGCGKTTTVKIAAGILKYNTGEAIVLDKKMPNLETMAKIGYMAQSDALYEALTAKENLEFFGAIYGLKKEKLKERIDYVAKLLNLTDELNKKVSSYSGGMKRRLSLCIALLHNPEVLILDEPTVGIDPVLREGIWIELRKLAQAGTTIVVTTHVMDEATKCDVLSMMREGKFIVTGTPNEIMEKAGAKDLEEAFICFGKSVKVENIELEKGVIK